jgi:DnaK suppressor protein
MLQPELEHFKRVLTELLDTAAAPLGRLDEIAVESAPEEVDRVQNAAARDLAIRQLESDALRIQNLESALDRIRDGSYGTCLLCEEPISQKRLAAVPWASYCVSCQSIIDEREKQSREHQLAA